MFAAVAPGRDEGVFVLTTPLLVGGLVNLNRQEKTDAAFAKVERKTSTG